MDSWPVAAQVVKKIFDRKMKVAKILICKMRLVGYGPIRTYIFIWHNRGYAHEI